MKNKILAAVMAGLLTLSAAPMTAMAAAGAYSTSLSSDDTVLTVTVDLGADAPWQLAGGSAGGLDLLTYEFNNGVFTASYLSNSSNPGADRLDLNFLVDGVSYGNCMVDVFIVENGEIQVTNSYASVDDYTPGSVTPGDAGEADTPTTPVVPTTYYVTAGSGLNIRQSPSSSAATVGSLGYGEAVKVIAISDGWATLVNENDSQWSGYCAAQYLSTSKPAPAATTPAPNKPASPAKPTKAPAKTPAAQTQTTAAAETDKKEDPWYDVTDTGALNVHLPYDKETEGIWTFTSSDDEALSFMTQSPVPADGKEVWDGTFMSAAQQSENVDLVLKRVLPDGTMDMSYIMELAIGADGKLSVVSAEKSWFELSDGTLTLFLLGNQAGGYEWEEAVADPSIAELITKTFVEEKDDPDDGIESDGYYNASFRGLKEGETILTLTYVPGEDDPDAKTVMRKMDLTVDAESKIQVKDVTVLK